MRQIGTANIIVCWTSPWGRTHLRRCLSLRIRFLIRHSGVEHHYVGRGGFRLGDLSGSVCVLALERHVRLVPRVSRLHGRVLGDDLSGGGGRQLLSLVLTARHEARYRTRCTNY
jgi:hypothetical protein